jgi:hypothetical protein
MSCTATEYPLAPWNDEDGNFTSEGHHDPQTFVGACYKLLREQLSDEEVEDSYPDGIQADWVSHGWAIFEREMPGTDEGGYRLRVKGIRITADMPGAVPLTLFCA